MLYNLFIYFPVNGHLCCFQFWVNAWFAPKTDTVPISGELVPWETFGGGVILAGAGRDR